MNNNTATVHSMHDSSVQILATEYVPVQQADFSMTFGLDEALAKGTVFPELYLPFLCERGAK